jgi:hypothetical protein
LGQGEESHVARHEPSQGCFLMKVWIYEAGRENMKVFASEEAAQRWIEQNDPEGVAFAYDVFT